MWLTYYVPGGDAELNARLAAWIGHRTAVAPPSAELRAARAANAALASENARLRAALDAATERLAERDQRALERIHRVAHHVRTPLGLIKGYIGTLLSGALDGDASSIHEFLATVDEETDAVSRLVNHLVDLSQLEIAGLQLDAGPVDLARLVREQVSREWRPQPVPPTLALDLPACLPAVWGDRARLEQVLRELLDNARRHTPPGGLIIIRAQPTPDQQTVEVTVQDSGPGLPPAALPHIGEAFYRVDAGDSRQAGGVGLGLCVAQGWVVAHGGRLWAENAPQGGARFHFTIPAAAAVHPAR